MVASREGHVEVVKSLLSHLKIDVNIQNWVSCCRGILLLCIICGVIVTGKQIGRAHV